MFKKFGNNKFKGYDWEQFEGVILYSSLYKKHIKDIRSQYTYLIFECGYGCDISKRFIGIFNDCKSNDCFIKAIEKYRNKV